MVVDSWKAHRPRLADSRVLEFNWKTVFVACFWICFLSFFYYHSSMEEPSFLPCHRADGCWTPSTRGSWGAFWTILVTRSWVTRPRVTRPWHKQMLRQYAFTCKTYPFLFQNISVQSSLFHKMGRYRKTVRHIFLFFNCLTVKYRVCRPQNARKREC